MNKRERILDNLTNHMPDYDLTKRYFFQHYELLRFLGGLNYFCFPIDIEDEEEALAIFLLGACYIFSKSIDDDPVSAKQAWKLALPLIEDVVPKEVKVKNYHISVQFEPFREASHE